MFISCILYVQERERETSVNPMEVAELQHQLELKEREKLSLEEQLEGQEEELERKQEELEIERIERERERIQKEKEKEEERNRLELVRQTYMTFFTF